MRRLIAFTGVAIMLASPALQAQGIDPDLARSFKLDFTVPESPAFNLLEVEGSDILRPATVRELSAAASDFVSGLSDVTIPESFGIEFAPLLILNGPKLSNADYRENRALYRTRISGATSRGSNVDPTNVNSLIGADETSRLAIGIRTTLLDGADLRTNDREGVEFRRFITGAATQTVRAKTAFQDSLVQLGLSVVEAATLTDEVYAAASAGSRRRALEGANLSGAMAADMLDYYGRLTLPDEDRIRQFRDSLQNALWNAPIVEIAAALLLKGQGNSADDLETQRWSLWGTGGLPVRSWGQFLIGIRVASERDPLTDDFDLQGSLSGRLYWGSNDLKGFIEGQGRFVEDEAARLLLNSGGELRLTGIAWIQFSAGLEFDRETETTDLVSDLTLQLTLP